MPPRRKLAAAPDPPAHAKAPDLRDSVKAATDAMTWLQPTDRALADVALKLAEQIEESQARADLLAELYGEVRGDPGTFRKLQKLEAMCDLAKTVGWLAPQLQGMLRDLGGTPNARKAMQADKPIGGRLAQLRAGVARQDDPEGVG